VGVGHEADAAGVELAGRGGEHGAILLTGCGPAGAGGGGRAGAGRLVECRPPVPIPGSGTARLGAAIRDVTEAKRAPLPEPPCEGQVRLAHARANG
jgi:hypothetical protein